MTDINDAAGDGYHGVGKRPDDTRRNTPDPGPDFQVCGNLAGKLNVLEEMMES
jgi:hypothetical protein